MKRPFAVKTSDLWKKVPKNALEEEKQKLKNISVWTNIYYSDQATLEGCIKTAESELTAIKKKKRSNLTRFGKFDEISFNNPTYHNDIVDVNSHDIIDIPMEKYNEVVEIVNSKDGDPEEVKKLIPQISAAIKTIKAYAKICRKNKQDHKKDFLKYLAQVNYGLKKEREYGPIPEVQTADNIGICEKWLKLENSERLTEERRTLISNIKC